MKLNLIVLVIALFSVAQCIEELNDQTFDKFVKENPKVVVMFYTTWCGACKSFMKTYKKLDKAIMESKSENQPQIKIARIDAEKYSVISDKFKIKGYPTLYYFSNGKHQNLKLSSVDGMIEHMAYLELPIYREFSNMEELTKVQEEYEIWSIFSGNMNDNLFNTFKNVAGSRRQGKMAFAVIQDESQASKITIYKKNDSPIEYKGEDKVGKLKAFIDINFYPTVMEVNRQTKNSQAKQNVPRFWLFTEGVEEKEQAKQLLESIQDDFKGRIQLCYCADQKIIKAHIKSEGIKLTTFVELQTQESLQISVIDGPQTKENLIEKLNAYFDGKIPLHQKSEQIPDEKDQGDVRIVVHNSFEKEVIEASKDKDVVVMYYAEWCSACKKLKPHYQKMAEEAKKKMPKLVFAKYDFENNAEDKVKLQYFPTVYMYKNGKGKEIKDFSRKKFINYYQQNGSFEWVEFDQEKEMRLKKQEKEQNVKQEL